MTISDNLFLSVSNLIGIRVTPDNFRAKIPAITMSGKIKTDILIELLMAVSELEKKIDGREAK